MDKQKIKRIIAREGLILSGFLFIAFILYQIGFRSYRTDVPLMIWEYPESGILFLIIFYPIYLIIRFIIWAVRILKAH